MRLIAAGLATVVVLALALPATAQEDDTDRLGIRLAEAPVERAGDPRAHVYVVDHVRPGATIERTVEVHNDGRRPLDVELYAGAAVVRGGAFVAQDGRGGNELARWTEVTPPRLRLAPGERAQAQVRITVPGDAADGERYAVVWAEPPAGMVGGVRIVNRVGVRLYLSVGAGSEPATDFVIESLTAARGADGAPLVQATVRNTGGRAIDLSGELALTEGPGGTTAGPFPARLGTSIEPGGAAPVALELSAALPDGPWLATLTLRSGAVERAATARLVFPAESGTAAEPVAAAPITPLQQRRVVGPVAAVILLLVAALAFRTRRRSTATSP